MAPFQEASLNAESVDHLAVFYEYCQFFNVIYYDKAFISLTMQNLIVPTLQALTGCHQFLKTLTPALQHVNRNQALGEV